MRLDRLFGFKLLFLILTYKYFIAAQQKTFYITILMKYVIDLFCGIGGFSCGTHMAGAKVLACFDMWEKALAIHYHNYPETDHFLIPLGGDIKLFSKQLQNYLNIKGVQKQNVHIHASPPCQSFTGMNSHYKVEVKDRTDDKINLFYWTLEFMKTFDTPTWSIEQVPNALKHLTTNNHWVLTEHSVNIYDRVYGYEFGAPTMRRRIFILNNILLTGTNLYSTTYKKRKKINKHEISPLNTIYDGESSNPFIEEQKKHNHTLCVHTLKHKLQFLQPDGSYVYVPVRRDLGESLHCINRSIGALCAPELQLWTQYADTDNETKRLIAYDFAMQYLHNKNHRIHQSRDNYMKHMERKNGMWKFVRNATTEERLFIQGFPSVFKANQQEHIVKYYSSFDLTPQKKSIMINRIDILRATGNTVIPLIAKEIIHNIQIK